MRLGLAAAVTLMLVFGTTPVGEARPGRRVTAKCPPARVHILRSGPRAVVYKTKETQFETIEGANGPERYALHVPVIRGCVRGHGRSHRLGNPYSSYGSPAGGGPNGIGSLRLSGDVVAFERAFESEIEAEPTRGTSRHVVVVINLRSGEVMHDDPTGTPPEPEANLTGVGPTKALVVKADGAVAWVVENRVSRLVYQVIAVDKTGTRVLATGSDISPHSLTLTGPMLNWTQGGKTFSAPLD